MNGSGTRMLRAALWLPRVIAGFALLAMMTVTLADVVGRHLFGIAVGGAVELVEFAQVWLIFLGIAIAFAASTHVSVDLVDSVLPAASIDALGWINRIVSVIVVAGLTWLAGIEYLDKLDFGDRTIDLRIPLTWFWAAVVVGFGLSVVFAIAAPRKAAG